MVQLHPTLAAVITRAVNSRATAADMINVVLNQKKFVYDDFLYWRDQHMRATAELAGMGIRLATYMGEDA